MGSSLQLLIQKGGKYRSCTPSMKLLVLFLSSSLAYGAVNLAKREALLHSHIIDPQCHNKKEQQCYKKPKHETHEECYVGYDVVVDITYIEECEHIEITTCEEESRKVHKTSHEVGHDSKVVDEYEEHHHFDFDTGPHCTTKKDKQCSKHPKEESHKVPKTLCKKIVDTIYIEECEEVVTVHCEESLEEKHHSSKVGEQQSQSIAHSEHYKTGDHH